MITLGPQGEPLLSEAELRDVSADGVGFGPTKVPTSAVASGTDREQAVKKFAASIVRGPQGEIILPPTEQGICPLCGADFPEACSQPGVEPDGFDDPNNAVVDDRENMFELLK